MTSFRYPSLLDETPEEFGRWIREVSRIRDDDIIDGDAVNELINGRLETVSLTPAASQNNYYLGIKGANSVQSTAKISPTVTMKITGILATGVLDGKILRIVNAGSQTAASSRLLLLERESASSDAANRLNWPPGYPPIMLMPGDWAQFEYDITSTRWRYTTGTRNFMSIRGNFDEFCDQMGVGASPFTTSSTGVGAGIANGTYLGGDTTERTMGAVEVVTGTDTTGRSYLTSGDTLTMFTGGCFLYACRAVANTTLSDGTERYQIRCGFHDASSGTDAVDGAYWEYDDSVSGDWRTVTSSNSTKTKTTVTGFTVSVTVYHTLGIFVNYDGTQVDYFYMTGGDAVTVAGTSHTTNIPPNTRYFGVAAGINKTAGTTSRRADFDWVGFRTQVKRGA